VSFFVVDDFWGRPGEVGAMGSGFLVGFQEGIVEDWVNFPGLGECQFTVSGVCSNDFEWAVSLGC
jgi:hypothetical protein